MIVRGTCYVYRLPLHDGVVCEFLIGHDNDDERHREYTRNERLVFHVHDDGRHITRLPLHRRRVNGKNDDYYASAPIIMDSDKVLPGRLGGMLPNGSPYLRNVDEIVDAGMRVSDEFSYKRHLHGGLNVHDTAAQTDVIFVRDGSLLSEYHGSGSDETLVSTTPLTTEMPVFLLPPSMLDHPQPHP